MVKSIFFWLPRLLLIGYAVACQICLAILHFVVAAPYLTLVLLPIPVLAPLVTIADETMPATRRLYLFLQLAGVTGQMALRVMLDLWLPVRL